MIIIAFQLYLTIKLSLAKFYLPLSAVCNSSMDIDVVVAAHDFNFLLQHRIIIFRMTALIYLIVVIGTDS